MLLADIPNERIFQLTVLPLTYYCNFFHVDNIAAEGSSGYHPTVLATRLAGYGHFFSLNSYISRGERTCYQLKWTSHYIER